MDKKSFLDQNNFWAQIFFWIKILFDPKSLWSKTFNFLEGAKRCHLIIVLWFKRVGQISDLKLTSFWYILVGDCSCCCSCCCCCYRGKTKSTPRLKSWSRSRVWQKRTRNRTFVFFLSISEILCYHENVCQSTKIQYFVLPF